MKKTYRLFCTVCLAGTLAFLASSCKKNDEQAAFKIVLPEFEEAIGEPDDADRAYIDFTTNTLRWQANDQVMIYNIDNEGQTTKKALYATDANALGLAQAHFDFVEGAALGEKQDHLFFFYPVSKLQNGTAALDADNREYFTVSRVQNYTLDKDGNPTIDPNAMALACETQEMTDVFSLKHIFGVCRLRLFGVNNMVVDSIQLVDNGMSLTGSVSMKLHEVNMTTFSDLMTAYKLVENGQPELSESFVNAWNEYRATLGYMPQGNGNTVTLNCHTDQVDGIALSQTAQTVFYISVRPGAFIKGFTINVFTNGNTTPYVIDRYSAPKDSYRIRAGVITGFNYPYVIGQ